MKEVSKNPKALVSSDRLPLDHFISGALIGGMSGFAMDYKTGKQNTSQLIKNSLKMAVGGGVVAAAGIGASNALVKGELLKAGAYIATGVATLVVLEKIFIKDDK